MRLQAIRGLDERWNHLPRKAALAAATLLAAAAALMLLPFVWPLALGFLLAALTKPFARIASKGRFSAKLSRRLAVLMLFGMLGALLALLGGWVVQALAAFFKSLPQLVAWMEKTVLPSVPPSLLSSLGQSALRLAGSLSARIAGLSIPSVLLGTVVALTSAYYFTVDQEAVTGFWQSLLPPWLLKRWRRMRRHLLEALLLQLRSQLMLSFVVTFFLMLTLGLSGMPHGVIIGMLIGLADALPVLGAGLFLIPWGLVSLISGQTATGIMLLCLYAGTMVLRQIVEPKLVGRTLGLHPLLTMGAMYAGYRAGGVTGFLIGPVLANLIRAVIRASEENRT